MILAITFSRTFIIMYNNLVSALNNIELIISINCLYGNFTTDLYLMESYIVRIIHCDIHNMYYYIQNHL